MDLYKLLILKEIGQVSTGNKDNEKLIEDFSDFTSNYINNQNISKKTILNEEFKSNNLLPTFKNISEYTALITETNFFLFFKSHL